MTVHEPPDLGGLFEAYGWVATQVEPGLWLARFSSEWEEEFDLYAMAGDEWVRFAILPLLPRPTEEAAPRLAATLLRINQRLQFVRFAVDDDGDICLQGDLPTAGLSAAAFAAALDMLVATTQLLARPLARMAIDPRFWPTELADLDIAG